MEYNKLPDAIHAGSWKEFTIIPNKIIRNPDLSSKAKTIICILLSNKDGWKSYQSTLEKMLKEGKDAIAVGLRELEKFGYLRRIKYRNMQTKVWAGSFWAYTDTPFCFDMINHIEELRIKGFECVDKDDDFEVNCNEMRNSEQWLTNISMKFNSSLDETKKNLDEFLNSKEIKIKGTSLQNMKNYFLNWMLYKYKTKQTDVNPLLSGSEILKIYNKK